jgi:uncharacterized membrane protein YeaQ/YmgE (transglycosylase-associated protein family)
LSRVPAGTPVPGAQIRDGFDHQKDNRSAVDRRRTLPSVDQLIVWIIVGLLGGSLAGLLVTWERAGFGRLGNFALGLAGALVGGLLFRLLGLFPNLDRISVSLRDIVAAVVGSILVLTLRWIWHWSRAGSATPASGR